MAQQRMNVQAPIKRLFAERWSSRAFDSAHSVPQDVLASCLEAARWTPSCFGEEPWRFIVADRFNNSAVWEQVLASLAPKNQAWAKNAPVLIVVSCTPQFANRDTPNRWCEYDTGQAAVCLSLQATALGLATHQMGGFDADNLRKVTHTPEYMHIMSVIALGYPSDTQSLHADFHSDEDAARNRRPIEQIAYRDAWNTPWLPPRASAWEARYQETSPEQLPWFHLDLDQDIVQALEKLDLHAGRLLDLGCGPGTQAVALAKHGFSVTASDVSPTAIEEAQKFAKKAGVSIQFVVDNILSTGLKDSFDMIIDRGCFHSLPKECWPDYVQAVRTRLKPDGVLLLKCFSSEETRPEGPLNRLSHEDVRVAFTPIFTATTIWNTHFHGQMEPLPKAVFAILKMDSDKQA